jgi:steroid delta-isomerase-like uncharacterized protein
MKISDLQKNKTVVQRYVDEIQNDHSIDAIESIFSGEFIDHMDTYGGLFQGIDGLKKGYTAAFQAFPDLKAIVRQMIAEEDMVVLHKTVMGTHRGEFRGIPATGKKVEYQSIYIFRIENNKISEYWGLQDELKLMQQLGVVAEDNSGKTD